jgi:hypothetical protein
LELPFFVQVTLETNFRRFIWIEDRIACPATLIVNAARPMARFAANVFRIGSLGFQAHMGCRLEIADEFGMTFGATL